MIYRSPKTTVGAIVYHPEKGKSTIVLTKRNIEPFKGQWCLPGGHIEIFENVKDAVIREVREETNLEFTPAFLGYSEEIFKELDMHYVALFFYGSGMGELKKDDKEVSEIGWFAIEDVIKMPLAFRHNDVIAEYRKLI